MRHETPVYESLLQGQCWTDLWLDEILYFLVVRCRLTIDGHRTEARSVVYRPFDLTNKS